MRLMAVVNCQVIELELTEVRDSFLDAGVLPEAADGISDVAGEDVALDLAGLREDDGAASVVLRGKLDVRVGHGLENGTGGKRGRQWEA